MLTPTFNCANNLGAEVDLKNVQFLATWQVGYCKHIGIILESHLSLVIPHRLSDVKIRTTGIWGAVPICCMVQKLMYPQ